MELNIISDILGKSKSIIPYGLELAKHLEATVNIIHIVDSRVQQGGSGPYANSQSITPGKIMSHDEIIQREKNIALKALDNLLSRETSKLNFPLKVKVDVEKSTIVETINKVLKKGGNQLFLINSEADNYIFHSRSEIIKTFENVEASVFLIPPGKTFHELKDILLITDFSDGSGVHKLIDNRTIIDRFNSLINAIDITKSNKYIEKEIESKSWFTPIDKSIFPSNIKTNVLVSDNYYDSLQRYIENTEPDLILPCKQNSLGILNKNSQNKLVKKLLTDTQTPILI